ncbi:hypothetical protein [Streptomyces sp. NPDC001502]|uniref:hypothetical protein n=1 Tax=Streptomyces sp. NPDC001502 TaxID=3364578 RepID=UPI00367E7691
MDLDLDLTERSIHHAGRLLVEGVRMWGLDELAPDLGLVVTVLGDRGLHIVRELAASVAITPSPGGGKDIVVIISTAPGILAADAVAA